MADTGSNFHSACLIGKLVHTDADSFHGLTKYSFDKNKFPVKEKKRSSTPPRHKISGKWVKRGKPRLRMNYFTTPVFELSGSGY